MEHTRLHIEANAAAGIDAMFSFSKAGFDPGHHAGANAGPGSYREGDVMLRLGLLLHSTYNAFLTRMDGSDITLPERARLAADAGIDTLISLHTNAPQAAAGVIVFYSVQMQEDKERAEYIGSEIAQAIGLKFRGAETRPSRTNPQTDYYGIIRHSRLLGISHPFIVEHGSHWEMAVNTEEKLIRIVEAYGRILQLKKADDTKGISAEIQSYVDILNKTDPQIIGERQKWIDKAADDRDIYWILRKAAAYVQAHE